VVLSRCTNFYDPAQSALEVMPLHTPHLLMHEVRSLMHTINCVMEV
jgi:hypothetical protein